MPDVSDGLHTVTVEFEGQGGFPRLRFDCLADAASDPACHMTCEHSECEEGCVLPYEHKKTNQGECMVTLWLEESDAEDCIFGGDTSVTAPIAYIWHGEGVDWRFAEARDA